ncbi:hypothetical protein BpHYR1_031109 [Brachionus plicatilis]|uniref:Uncharacterized protein n=1 Tax=Brachionus plicatilis TaxID=10195 RepID=A0A3M7RSD6_BRAPC|nr:hypothetical protein BpHYR1_031109 [Brachionus plicatilis]
MTSNAFQKAKLQEKRLHSMYNKRARVTVNDLELFKINIILLVFSLFFIISGTVIIGVLLGGVGGRDAITDINLESFDNNSTTYLYYIGAHIGAVVAGLGVFLLILCLVGVIDDYSKTKKRLIEKIIKEDQDRAAAEAAKNANMNIFQMLALNAKKNKLAN